MEYNNEEVGGRAKGAEVSKLRLSENLVEELLVVEAIARRS
jgi:hypothetical protein